MDNSKIDYVENVRNATGQPVDYQTVIEQKVTNGRGFLDEQTPDVTTRTGLWAHLADMSGDAEDSREANTIRRMEPHFAVLGLTDRLEQTNDDAVDATAVRATTELARGYEAARFAKPVNGLGAMADVEMTTKRLGIPYNPATVDDVIEALTVRAYFQAPIKYIPMLAITNPALREIAELQSEISRTGLPVRLEIPEDLKAALRFSEKYRADVRAAVISELCAADFDKSESKGIKSAFMTGGVVRELPYMNELKEIRYIDHPKLNRKEMYPEKYREINLSKDRMCDFEEGADKLSEYGFTRSDEEMDPERYRKINMPNKNKCDIGDDARIN